MKKQAYVQSYLNDANNFKGNFIFKIDEELDNNIYDIFNDNTMLFMFNKDYDEMSPKTKEIISNTLPDETELSANDMINKDIMTFLIDDIDEVKNLTELIKKYYNSINKKDLYYCIVIFQ